MNRRQFLGHSGLVFALASLPSTAAFDILLGGGRATNLLFDQRLPNATALGAAAAQGLTPFGFDGDPSELWYERLGPDLRRGIPLIGVSAAVARFCIEVMAGTDGRLVRSTRHDPDAVVDWPGVAWDLVRQTTASDAAKRLPRLALDPSHQHGRGQFESWLLLPRPATTPRDGIQ